MPWCPVRAEVALHLLLPPWPPETGHRARGRPTPNAGVGRGTRGHSRTALCADAAGDRGPGAQRRGAEAGHHGQGGASQGGPDPSVPALPPAQRGALPGQRPVQVPWGWRGHRPLVRPLRRLPRLWGPREPRAHPRTALHTREDRASPHTPARLPPARHLGVRAPSAPPPLLVAVTRCRCGARACSPADTGSPGSAGGGPRSGPARCPSGSPPALQGSTGGHGGPSPAGLRPSLGHLGHPGPAGPSPYCWPASLRPPPGSQPPSQP